MSDAGFCSFDFYLVNELYHSLFIELVTSAQVVFQTASKNIFKNPAISTLSTESSAINAQ
jgi:hypothetical protein